MLLFLLTLFLSLKKINETPNPENVNIPKSDLNKLFKSWGFEVEAGMIVGDIINGRKVSLGSTNDEKILTYILWLALQRELLSDDDIVTENLDYVFFKSAGSIINLDKSKKMNLYL